MAGRFEGLSDLEWKLFEDVFPEPVQRGRGMPHTAYRSIINTLMYILITGCRWCDVPRERQWASKSSAHRWLKRWSQDGTLVLLQERIINIAQEQGLIRWEYGAVDGSFSPWQRGR
ncbi:MAG: transposase [Aphanocapsa sp. GSE-SYN-MK-11-07L]|nr:transposase [Aphanocapsa sp. GSE-SYN-MK-11-07L]